MKKLTIPVVVDDVKSLDLTIEFLKEYQKWLNIKLSELINEFAQLGVEKATIKYDNAYTTNDGDITVEIQDSPSGKGKLVVALGWAVLFMEFGTGITYPDIHPEKPDDVLPRGTYGRKTAGRYGLWAYNGDVGKNPPPDTYGVDVNGHTEVYTKGIPASMAMYLTREELLQEAKEIIERVFRYD